MAASSPCARRCSVRHFLCVAGSARHASPPPPSLSLSLSHRCSVDLSGRQYALRRMFSVSRPLLSSSTLGESGSREEASPPSPSLSRGLQLLRGSFRTPSTLFRLPAAPPPKLSLLPVPLLLSTLGLLKLYVLGQIVITALSLAVGSLSCIERDLLLFLATLSPFL